MVAEGVGEDSRQVNASDADRWMVRPELPEVRVERQLDLLARGRVFPRVSQDVREAGPVRGDVRMARPELPEVRFERQLDLLARGRVFPPGLLGCSQG